MSGDTRRPSWRRVWGRVGGAVIAILVAVIAPEAVWQAVFALAAGWIPFLRHTVPRMTVDWPQVWLTLAALGAFVAGLHRFLRWLLRDGATVAASAWRFRWTAAVATLVLVMFVAGTAMVGIVHQFVWLARSDEPWTKNSFRQIFDRRASSGNLKGIAQAAIGHERQHGVLPAGVVADADGRPLHGWMTMLLPFIDEGELFVRVRLDESWDSAANAPVFATRVHAYENPGIDRQRDAPDLTRADYAANALVIGPGEPLGRGQIEDGAARTILAGEVMAGRVPWGQPGNSRDPRRGLDPASPDAFGGPWEYGMVQVVFADGHVGTVSPDIDPRLLDAIATPRGGETVTDCP